METARQKYRAAMRAEHGLPPADDRHCDMPTRSLRMCNRRARYVFTLHGRDVLAVCAQHYTSHGHAHLLRPFPWEADTVRDLTTGERWDA